MLFCLLFCIYVYTFNKLELLLFVLSYLYIYFFRYSWNISLFNSWRDSLHVIELFLIEFIISSFIFTFVRFGVLNTNL